MKRKILSIILVVVMVVGMIPATMLSAVEEDTQKTVSLFEATRTDFRDESVYTLMISRFYDGDSGNNVYCWDDAQAGNTENHDPAWRGDFKGLIDKLDYIKALGFTAVRLNCVAQNASGYDYHGEHPINLKDIDFRLESDGFTYTDVIDACHGRGLKIMQDVMLNSTSNFGEEFLCKLFELNEETQWSITESMIPTETLLAQYPNYANMAPSEQFVARMDMLKAHITESLNADEHYHREKNMSYTDAIQQQGTIAGDCIDINTENPVVALYLATSCAWYAEMGVDAICITNVEYINRWTLNEGILPLLRQILSDADLEIEIYYINQSRSREVWPMNNESISIPFYSWAETNEEWKGNWNSSDPTANIQTSIDHFNANMNPSDAPTSTNHSLNGLDYHTPDYSKSNGMRAFDFMTLWSFENANNVFAVAKGIDKYMNDATWNLVSVDSWDYGPDGMETKRYSLGVQSWQTNLNLIFTFRGIPSVLYGTEIEFAKNNILDAGPNLPLAETGRAYYGDNLEGTLTVTDFGEYTAEGTIATTLDSELSQHIRKLNNIRQNVPALRKGQYTTDSNYVSGNMAFIRRYTGIENGVNVDSLALVTIGQTAVFKNIPNGLYIDAVSGDSINVTNGTLSTRSMEANDLAVYVCCADGFTGIGADASAPELTLRFYANGGIGKMDKMVSDDTFVLPECTFTAPEEAEFLGWIVNGKMYDAGDTVSIPVDSMARAVWSTTYESEIPVYSTISAVANPSEGGNVFGAGNYKNGTTVTLEAISNQNYTFDGWWENDVEVSSDSVYTFAVDQDRNLAAKFAVNEQPENPDPTPGSDNSFIYFKGSESFTQVYAFVWSSSGVLGKDWPGTAMTDLGEGLWKFEIPDGAENIIFNDGCGWQTSDLVIPTDGKNLYEIDLGWSVNQSESSDKSAEITGASITLGVDLSLNYYVEVYNDAVVGDGQQLAMQVTMNNKSVTLYSNKKLDSGEYVFTFTGITPQCMADIIDATLAVIDENGEVEEIIATKEGYSVKENAESLLEEYPEDIKLKQLIADMLAYGAAAQNYRDYNTENLADKDLPAEITPSEVLPAQSDMSVTNTTSETVYFKSKTVWFANVNKLCVKLSAKENVVLKINGEVADMVGEYYCTDAISATEFDTIYTFVIYEADGETPIQTLCCNISSYVYSIMNKTLDGEPTEMALLAQALYRYGVSARAYQNG